MIFLEKMYKKRLLSKGLRQIEDFERMNMKVREYNDVECIIPLCKVMDEDTECNSATEAVLETIMIFVQRYKADAICRVLKATPDLIINGETWAILLHTMILQNKNYNAIYKEEYKKLDETEKNVINDLLYMMLDEEYINKDDVMQLI